MNRISGKNFNTLINGLLVHVEEVTLDIEDNSATAMTNGVPDGVLDGSVSASGELRLDAGNFNKIVEVARIAGSFRGIDPVDIIFTAVAGLEGQLIIAYGCNLKISAALNINAQGGEKSLHVLPYEVTSPDFISINGVPYLKPEEIATVTVL